MSGRPRMNPRDFYDATRRRKPRRRWAKGGDPLSVWTMKMLLAILLAVGVIAFVCWMCCGG